MIVRLDLWMSILGIIFLLVVLGSTILHQGGALNRVFEISIWVLWVIFVIEFVLQFLVTANKRHF